MEIRVVAPRELSASDRERWLRLQRASPLLASPYFHPEFTLAVAGVRDDVRVAVLEEGGDTVGFFPFQRGRFGIGGPVGGQLSDHHGVIAGEQAAFDAVELVRGAGLAVWVFDHLLAAQAPFRAFHRVAAESPVLDLSQGFDAYLRRRREAGSERIAQIQRKARKLEREVGGVELVAHRVDHAVLDQVVRWKSAQCRRTRVFDFFSRLPWTVPLVRRIVETESDGFAGMLSILHAGGRVAAAHLGMRSETVLHWWFPVYDPEDELARYSPGGILLLKLAEQAAGMGLRVLDLGKGDDPYKDSFRTGAIPLAEGAVEVPSIAATLRRSRIRSEEWLRRSPALAPLREGVRALRRLRRRLRGGEGSAPRDA